MIIFLFCFVWVDGPLTVQLKSSITSHKTTKLDFFMIIYPVIFSMPDISVAEHVDEFKYPAHWLLFQLYNKISLFKSLKCSQEMTLPYLG